jgi:hypothetical protein
MNALQIANEKVEMAARAARTIGRPILPNQLTTSVLRSDTLCVSGQDYTNISFNYSKPSPNSTDILLQINDLFVATAIRLSAKKLTATPTAALQAAAQEFTYPNTFVFDGTTEVTAIFGLWNATLTFKQNTDIAFPKMWTGDLKFAPDQMYGDITGLITGPTYSRKIGDSKNSPNYGWCPVEPLVMKGTDQLYASLSLAASLNLTETNEYNYFTISFRGYLVSGINAG